MSNDYPNRRKWLAIRDSKRFTRRAPKMRPSQPIRNIREAFGLDPRDQKPPRIMRGRGTNPHARRAGPGRRHQQGKIVGRITGFAGSIQQFDRLVVAIGRKMADRLWALDIRKTAGHPGEARALVARCIHDLDPSSFARDALS